MSYTISYSTDKICFSYLYVRGSNPDAGVHSTGVNNIIPIIYFLTDGVKFHPKIYFLLAFLLLFRLLHLTP